MGLSIPTGGQIAELDTGEILIASTFAKSKRITQTADARGSSIASREGHVATRQGRLGDDAVSDRQSVGAPPDSP